MLFFWLYLCSLIIAPQLWLEPFVGLRTDVLLFPLWFLWLLATGRAADLVRLRSQDWFFLAFVAWMVVSIVVNPPNPYAELLITTYAKWFVLYRFVIATVPSLARIRTTLLLLLAIGLLIAVEGIQHMHSEDGLGWAGQSFAWMDEQAAAAGLAGRTRWVGIFDGPGVFCVIYTITLPVAMHLAMPPFGWVTRFAGAGMTGLLLLATYYTGSRGGFLATVGVFGLFLLTRLNISVPRMMLAVGAMLVVFLAAPSHLTSTSDSHGSAQHRVSMWGEGIEMVEQNPVFGIGRGKFASYTGRLIAHNSGIEIMGEMGLPGIFLWLGMIYLAYRNIFAARAGIEDPKDRAYLMALALALAGYLLSSLFVTLEYETLYILLALAAAAGRHAKVPPPFTRRDALFVAGIVVAFFVGFKSLVMLYF
ncbi:MAG: O-antigen ligase family protein [Betaproteobacteria bacterium]|nr:O-antigen ligase family protein [Betaproteobacteria bacterium]